MNKTIFKYIFKMQLKAMIFVSISMFCLISLFDFAEVIRKFPISDLNEAFFAIKLTFLRSPSTFCEILHYIYFITATFSLWNLCRSHQITILKSAGRSPQQILYPFVGFSFFIAAIWLFVIHPVGLLTEEMYNKNISHDNSNYSESNHDIWIDYRKNDQMIFIKDIAGNKINGLYIFNTKNNERIFSRCAEIKNHIWTLKDIMLFKNNSVNNISIMNISNGASSDLIKLFSKSSKKQDIYSLYKIYRIQKKDNVLLKLYELALHKLLSNCASFVLFALLAAVICFPINRYKTKTNISIKVISAAIFYRFTNNIFESLAYSGVISVQLACWGMLLILLCFSVAILIWREA